MSSERNFSRTLEVAQPLAISPEESCFLQFERVDQLNKDLISERKVFLDQLGDEEQYLGDQTFDYSLNRADLLSTVNKRTRTFKCPICSKTFPKFFSMKVHIYNHMALRPYGCPEPGCSKQFSESGN